MSIEVVLPYALQLVIDDVGWWSGSDDSERQGPYRTGIQRDHVLADYQAIAALGKELGMRPQAAFIACEWDRHNRLRHLPEATWMGNDWDNTHRVGEHFDQTAHYICENDAFMELAIHGLGHEYWHEDGSFSRAEWADMRGIMRPKEVIEAHLDTFEQILEDNEIDVRLESFVPTAFLHEFMAERGIEMFLGSRGIKYISTAFSSLKGRERMGESSFGICSGTMILDRGRCGVPWDEMNCVPTVNHIGPILGIHWANLLHPDPEQNESSLSKYVDYLREQSVQFDLTLARDTSDCWNQLIHRELVEVELSESSIHFDLRELANIGFEKSEEFYFKTRGRRLDLVNDGVQIDELGCEGDQILYRIGYRADMPKFEVELSQ